MSNNNHYNNWRNSRGKYYKKGGSNYNRGGYKNKWTKKSVQSVNYDSRQNSNYMQRSSKTFDDVSSLGK